MAFETRTPGGARYLYLSRRDPLTGAVKKVYVGRGPKAEADARDLEQRREQREAERRAVEKWRAELRPAADLMAALDEAVSLLMEAALLAEGYHRPNYCPWRRRRRRDGHGGHRGAVPAGRAG
jgi:hypothetical protein